ncbi:hypothetical protein AVEN_91054-1 [Araneus ventricosus]|uniref:Uncharacterized protein n=1 Tax=Araneus ventricosus TaxID=182803 RepID=A0A4Y2KVF1_ARAVE|nr:hypothetical protein AVEN_91054-1 [Araneus ventricosus]
MSADVYYNNPRRAVHKCPCLPSTWKLPIIHSDIIADSHPYFNSPALTITLIVPSVCRLGELSQKSIRDLVRLAEDVLVVDVSNFECENKTPAYLKIQNKFYL